MGKAQRAAVHSAGVIINAIIDQIDQGRRIKGADESGPPVLSTTSVEDRLLHKVMDKGHPTHTLKRVFGLELERLTFLHCSN